MQEEIPVEVTNLHQVKLFSNYPENIQIQALQNNVYQSLCAMKCADVVGGNFLMSVLSVILRVNGCEEEIAMITEMENQTNL